MKADSEWHTWYSLKAAFSSALHTASKHMLCVQRRYALARHSRVKNLTRSGEKPSLWRKLLSSKILSEVNIWFLQYSCRSHRYCVAAFHIFFRLTRIAWLFWEFLGFSRSEWKWGQWLEFGMSCSLKQTFSARIRHKWVDVLASQQAEVNTNQIRRSRELVLCLLSRGRVADLFERLVPG